MSLFLFIFYDRGVELVKGGFVINRVALSSFLNSVFKKTLTQELVIWVFQVVAIIVKIQK